MPASEEPGEQPARVAVVHEVPARDRKLIGGLFVLVFLLLFIAIGYVAVLGQRTYMHAQQNDQNERQTRIAICSLIVPALESGQLPPAWQQRYLGVAKTFHCSGAP